MIAAVSTTKTWRRPSPEEPQSALNLPITLGDSGGFFSVRLMLYKKCTNQQNTKKNKGKR